MKGSWRARNTRRSGQPEWTGSLGHQGKGPWRCLHQCRGGAQARVHPVSALFLMSVPKELLEQGERALQGMRTWHGGGNGCGAGKPNSVGDMGAFQGCWRRQGHVERRKLARGSARHLSVLQRAVDIQRQVLPWVRSEDPGKGAPHPMRCKTQPQGEILCGVRCKDLNPLHITFRKECSYYLK